MSGGWFTAGRRAHFAASPLDRSLCGAHEAPVSLTAEHGVRQCARCARLQADAQTTAEQDAYRASLAPARPVGDYARPLTDAEKADAATLAHGMKHRARIDRERSRWA